jgi:uncharacterized protein (TIGR02246 family)
MRILLALAVLLMLAGCDVSVGHGDEAAVRSVLDRFVRAVNEANVDEFVACFEEDASAFFPSQANAVRRVGREAIRAAVTPSFALGPPATPVEPRDLTITVEGLQALVTFDGGRGEAHARRTLVLRRRGDRWAIAHLHASNLTAAPIG